MTITANWSYPTAIKFGAGRIKELADHCKAVGIKRPLLVTDRGLAPMAITQNALDILDAAGLGRAIFADVDSNPNDRNLDAGVIAFKSGGHDGVVAFGGGSGLDLGKCVAFMAGQSRPVWDFEDVGDWWTRAKTEGIAPIIAVPTTAGTGSEVGRASVITHLETHTKKVIFHPKMMPVVTICDPALTVGLPAHLTAAQLPDIGAGDGYVIAFGACCQRRSHRQSAAPISACWCRQPKLSPCGVRIGFSDAIFPSPWRPEHGRTRHPMRLNLSLDAG